MVGIKVEGKQPRKEQMVVTWNQGLLGPQTTQGSFCGSTLVFVSYYCEDREARVQLKEVRNVREASAMWRGVKWHRVLQKPQEGARRNQGQETTTSAPAIWREVSFSQGGTTEE